MATPHQNRRPAIPAESPAARLLPLSPHPNARRYGFLPSSYEWGRPVSLKGGKNSYRDSRAARGDRHGADSPPPGDAMPATLQSDRLGYTPSSPPKVSVRAAPAGEAYRAGSGQTTLVPAHIRLLIIDPDPSVRRGLRMRLALEPDLAVVGEASDVVMAQALAESVCPDVILLDTVASCLDGLSAATELARRTCSAPVVMLSLLDDCRTRYQTAAAGAAAFVGKHESVDRLLATIRHVAQGAGPEPRPCGKAA